MDAENQALQKTQETVDEMQQIPFFSPSQEVVYMIPQTMQQNVPYAIQYSPQHIPYVLPHRPQVRNYNLLNSPPFHDYYSSLPRSNRMARIIYDESADLQDSTNPTYLSNLTSVSRRASEIENQISSIEQRRELLGNFQQGTYLSSSSVPARGYYNPNLPYSSHGQGVSSNLYSNNTYSYGDPRSIDRQRMEEGAKSAFEPVVSSTHPFLRTVFHRGQIRPQRMLYPPTNFTHPRQQRMISSDPSFLQDYIDFDTHFVPIQNPFESVNTVEPPGTVIGNTRSSDQTSRRNYTQSSAYVNYRTNQSEIIDRNRDSSQQIILRETNSRKRKSSNDCEKENEVPDEQANKTPRIEQPGNSEINLEEGRRDKTVSDENIQADNSESSKVTGIKNVPRSDKYTQTDVQEGFNQRMQVPFNRYPVMPVFPTPRYQMGNWHPAFMQPSPYTNAACNAPSDAPFGVSPSEFLLNEASTFEVPTADAAAAVSSKSGNTKVCKVCNDDSSGLHYGAETCEECRNFFRRAVEQKIGTECETNCSIRKGTRNRCQSCWFKKCLEVGMKPELVGINK